RDPRLDTRNRRDRRRRLRLRQRLSRHPCRRPHRGRTVLRRRHAGGGPGGGRGRRAQAPPGAGGRGRRPRGSVLGRAQLLLRRSRRLPLVLWTAEAGRTGRRAVSRPVTGEPAWYVTVAARWLAAPKSTPAS